MGICFLQVIKVIKFLVNVPMFLQKRMSMGVLPRAVFRWAGNKKPPELSPGGLYVAFQAADLFLG